MKKIFCLFCIIQTLCFAVESKSYWYSKLPDNWEVYYEIISKDGEYSGKFVSYLSGMQFAGDDMGDITITEDSLSMITNVHAYIFYKGGFNNERNTIQGANYYPDGSTLEIILNKVDDSIAKAFSPRKSKTLSTILQSNDGIPISSLKNAGFSRNHAETLINDIIDNKVGEIHAILIAKDSKLVLEEYFYDYDINKTHRLHSCTKSVISLLVGKAIETGKISGLETTLDQLFPDQRMNNKYSKVTLEDLLGMTSGFGKLFVSPDSSGKWIQEILTSKPISKPGKKFRYDDNNSHLIGDLLCKSTSRQIDEYANQILFKPLGINNFHWEYEDGYPKAHTGLALTARDFLKIGILVSQNGNLQGEQIINEEWIIKSTTSRKKAHKTLDYGLHWWRLKKGTGNFPLAQGAGGQRLYIIPDKNIVCVVFGGNFDSWYPLDDYIWNIIEN